MAGLEILKLKDKEVHVHAAVRIIMNNLFDRNLNISFIARQVLMSAYLYYKRDRQVLTDHENDANVKLLAQNWWRVPERYKTLLNNVSDGTITTFDCRYTRLVEAGAISWLKARTGEVIQPLGEGYYEKRRTIT